MLDFRNTIKTWFLGIACSVNTLFVGVANAQITPDSTLPNNSEVKLEGNINKIEGGTTAGSNLFHSFKEFSIPTGKEAHFNNAVDISNIITRVTGKSISDIDGLIKANGTANLFLINPSGIVFGENARLDIGGSFVGSTADAVGFSEDDFFSASSPESSSSLLKVNPNALFFNQVETASIQNNSVADLGLNQIGDLTPKGLRVPNGESLLLVGGDINIDSGGLVALGGRVELGGLTGTGTVALNGDENNLSLSFPDGVERSDVSLSNGAGVAVVADNGGSIAVNARNLEMTGGSLLAAGIENGLGSDNNKAGNIDVNVTDAINLNNKSDINNSVLPGASGQGGDVNISASTLQIKNAGSVSANTFGAGKAGNLTVDAQHMQVIGESKDGSLSVSILGASAEPNSTGDAGDLTIKTNTLLVKDGAQVGSGTFGEGKGGNLTINAQDVQLIGTSKEGLPGSGLFSSAQGNATKDAGDLTIKTNTLLVKDGAQVFTGTLGEGKGGNLTVNAQDVQLIGTSKDGQSPSVLVTTAQPGSTADAGDLTIKTNTLLVQDGAIVSVSTSGKGKAGNLKVDAQDVQLVGTSKDGQFDSALSSDTQPDSTGNAGNVTIKTNTLLVKDGAQVSSATFSDGKGGNLTINAQDVQLIGISKDGQFPSYLSTSTQPDSTGDAGNLTIKTHTLLVQDGADVFTGTFGEGNGGNLTVDAQDVQLIGTSKDGGVLGTSAQPDSKGDAGDLTIKTNTLLVKDGGQVGAATLGEGKGGNLTIDAQNVRLIGTSKDGQFRSALATTAQPDSIGDAGDLTINTDILQVENGAGLSVQTFTIGTAGNLIINADSIRLNNNALITANTRSNKVDPSTEQATININSQDLIMRRGSNIRTNAEGENVVGGNININTDILAALENSDISANSVDSGGGNVRIESQGIFGTQFRPQSTPQSDITATGVNEDSSGTVEVITPDTDTNSGLVNLPTIPIETEVQAGCTDGSPLAQSSFEITGRSGLPPNPSEALTNDAVLVDLVTLKPEDNNRSTATVSTEPTTSKPKKIVEATGFSRNKKGEIFLVADASNGTNRSEWNKNTGCRGLN